MSVRISQKEPYTVTLDSLDMQYIHTNMSYMEHSKMADLKPIWSRNCEGKNYYEFEIVPGSDNSHNESLDDMKLQLCHICNINVPAAYSKEHHESDKHKTMQKLSRMVLERVVSSIIVNTDIIENKRKDVYYCAACSIVLLKSDVLDHNTSKKHSVSIKYDEMMKQYLDLYMNGMAADLINDLYAKELSVDKAIIDLEKINAGMINAENDICEKMNGIIRTDLKNNIESANMNTTVTSKVSDDVWNLKCLCKNNAKDNTVTKEELNEFVTEKGNNVNLVKEYDKTFDKKVELVIEKDKNVDEIVTNKSSQDEISIVGLVTDKVESIEFVPIEDRNVEFETDEDRNVKLKLDEDENVKLLPDEQTNVEFVTNKDKNEELVPGTDSTVELVTKSNINTELVTKACNYDDTLTRMDKNNVTYKPVPLENDDSSIILYNQGYDKIKIPINNFHSFLVNGTKYHCMLCDVNREETSQEHIKSDCHIEKVLKPINKHLMRQANDTYSHCVICNVMTRAGDKHTTENISHDNFLKGYMMKPAVKKSYKYCDSCDRDVDVNDIHHETSVEHALSALKISDNKENILPDCTPSDKGIRSDVSDDLKVATVPVDESDSKKNVISDVMPADLDPKMYCVICNVKVPKTAETIKEHTASSRHGTNLTNFMTENQIKMTGDRYHCKLCDIITKNLMRHVNYITHKEKYSKYKSDNAQNELDTTKNQPHTSHNNFAPIKQSDNKQNIIKQPNQPDNIKNIKIFEHNFCNICRVKVSMNSRLTHEVGFRHTTELSKLLGADVSTDIHFSDQQKREISVAKREYMVLINNGRQLRCQICMSAICNRDTHIYEHISGWRHNENYRLYLNKK